MAQADGPGAGGTGTPDGASDSTVEPQETCTTVMLNPDCELIRADASCAGAAVATRGPRAGAKAIAVRGSPRGAVGAANVAAVRPAKQHAVVHAGLVALAAAAELRPRELRAAVRARSMAGC